MIVYTIKEIADLADVTTRTIRYYDEIGLLDPADIGENGYRYYDNDSLLRLQQILFFKELDVPLKEINLIINRPEFNLVDALEKHRSSLKIRVKRLNALIATIDSTIEVIQGEKKMAKKDYFKGFNEAQYENKVKECWGNTPQYAESSKKRAVFSKEQKKAIKAEGMHIAIRMVGTDPNISPDDPDVQAAVGEYHMYLNKYFYTCDVSFLGGLADMWVEDVRFAVNYEKIREGGTKFVRDAVHIFCDKNG
jgi:DNA-binding transcriptional MerR regulator